MSDKGRICPQCSYERQPKDLAPDYECPRCGIIYAKYRPPEPKPPLPAPGKEPAVGGVGAETEMTDEEEQLQPASPLRRAFAGIYTFSRVILYFVPVKLVVYAGFRFVYPPESIKSWTDMAKVHSWEAAYYIYLVLLMIYAFFVRPWLDGRTWGQEKFNVLIRPKDDLEGSLSFKAYLLRFTGNLVAVGTWPITMGGLLYDLFAKRNDPGIADRISSTRQYETETTLPFRSGLNKAFMPLCIAIILQIALVGPLSLFIMKGYMQSNRAQKSVKPAQESVSQRMQQLEKRQLELTYGPSGSSERVQSGSEFPERRSMIIRQKSIHLLSAMEAQHLADYGSYTEELEPLISKYCTDPTEMTELLNLVSQGIIRARKTDKGVEIWLQTPDGEWMHEEMHQ